MYTTDDNMTTPRSVPGNAFISFIRTLTREVNLYA